MIKMLLHFVIIEMCNLLHIFIYRYKYKSVMDLILALLIPMVSRHQPIIGLLVGLVLLLLLLLQRVSTHRWMTKSTTNLLNRFINMEKSSCFVFYLALIVGFVSALPSVPVLEQDDAPKWPKVYSVEGTLLLPYAEIEEPFSGYYDSTNKRSRIDYYGGIYTIYVMFMYKSSKLCCC